MEGKGGEWGEGLRAAAAQAGVPVQINRVGSMLTLFFRDSPVRCFEEARQADVKRFSVFVNGLRDRGVLIPPSPFEAWCVSAAHTRALLQDVIAQASEALNAC